MEMYRELGLTYDRSIPIVETSCRYPSPCYFDDLLEIHTWLSKVGTSSFTVRSEVYHVEDDGALVLVGEGHTVHVHIDDNRSASPLPPQCREAFEKVAG
jgi:acyl-CoA thioester hydrolase